MTENQEPEVHLKLKKLFESGVEKDSATTRERKTQSQKLVNTCKRESENIIYLASLIADTVDGNNFTNAIFVLQLLSLLSRKDAAVSIISDFGNILSFIIKNLTVGESKECRDLAVRCVTNVSKCKSGKYKLPQVSDFLSWIYGIISAPESNEYFVFAISTLSRLLEIRENRNVICRVDTCFADTSFYDKIGTLAISSESEDYMRHMCRLLLQLSRIEIYRGVIAQSGPVLSAMKCIMRKCIEQGASSLPCKHVVVSLMNLAGNTENRVRLGDLDDLIQLLVKIALLGGSSNSTQYSIAALLNLAWEKQNGQALMSAHSLLDVLVGAMNSKDTKASMYAAGIICNLTCVEEYQLILGQSSAPDLMLTLVNLVKTSAGFTKDDAMGSLSNLSMQSQNRELIAIRIEKLGIVFEYIRTHGGVCRKRAMTLLKNLCTSYSSLDHFLLHDEYARNYEQQMQIILNDCDSNESAESTILQQCIVQLSSRRQGLSAVLDATSHSAVGYDKSENKTLFQPIKSNDASFHTFEARRKKHKESGSLHTDAHTENIILAGALQLHPTLTHKEGRRKEKKNLTMPIRSDVSATLAVGKTSPLEIIRQSNEGKLKSKNSKSLVSQVENSKKKKDDNMSRNETLKNPTDNNAENLKGEGIGQVYTKAFTSPHIPGLSYSSDDSDNALVNKTIISKKKRKKDTQGPYTKVEHTSNIAEPKDLRIRRKKERKGTDKRKEETKKTSNNTSTEISRLDPPPPLTFHDENTGLDISSNSKEYDDIAEEKSPIPPTYKNDKENKRCFGSRQFSAKEQGETFFNLPIDTTDDDKGLEVRYPV